MCVDPVSASLAVAGLAASVYGGVQASHAAQSQANAIRDQNISVQRAQNQAFQQRMSAALNQTQAQSDVANTTMDARNQAATQMRQSQDAALTGRKQILDAENAQAETLRGQGDAQAQALLAATSKDALDKSQTDAQAQQAALLANATQPSTGPEASDPSGGGPSGNRDDATTQALGRRLNQAATNVRSYGSDIAKVGSYNQPLQGVNMAIADNRTGIMPAQAADTLLRSGSAIRLLPSSIAYNNAANTGQTLDALLQSRGEGRMNVAQLDYGNTVANANLGQSDADTLAANTAAQKTADAEYQKQIAQLYGSIGNLGLYGAAYRSGVGSSLLKPATA